MNPPRTFLPSEKARGGGGFKLVWRCAHKMGQNVFGAREGLREEVGQNASAKNGGCTEKLAQKGQDIKVNLTQKMGQSGLPINKGMNSKYGPKEQPGSGIITGLIEQAGQNGVSD